jgi:hypothetical protein
MSEEVNVEDPFYTEVIQLIEQSKQNVAIAVNAEITLLYWNVGKRINNEILKNERAEYGKQIVVSLSRQLETEYGKGWGEKQLNNVCSLQVFFKTNRFSTHCVEN